MVLKMLNLAWSMDGMTITNQCVLVHNSNDRPTVGVNNTANGTNINISKLVIVDTTNVNCSVGFEQDTDVTTSETTVCTAINERHGVALVCFRCRHIVANMGHISGAGGGFRHDASNITRRKLGLRCLSGIDKDRVGWFVVIGVKRRGIIHYSVFSGRFWKTEVMEVCLNEVIGRYLMKIGFPFRK